MHSVRLPRNAAFSVLLSANADVRHAVRQRNMVGFERTIERTVPDLLQAVADGQLLNAHIGKRVLADGTDTARDRDRMPPIHLYRCLGEPERNEPHAVRDVQIVGLVQRIVVCGVVIDEHAVADDDEFVGLRFQPWRSEEGVNPNALHAVGNRDRFQPGLRKGFGADLDESVGQHDALECAFGVDVVETAHLRDGMPVQLGGDDHLFGRAEVVRDRSLATLG